MLRPGGRALVYAWAREQPAGAPRGDETRERVRDQAVVHPAAPRRVRRLAPALPPLGMRLPVLGPRETQGRLPKRPFRPVRGEYCREHP